MNTNLILSLVGKYGAILVAIYASFLVYKFAINVLKFGEKKGKEMIHNYDVNIQEKGQLSEKQLYMSKTGIMYRFGKYDMKPSDYTIVRVLCGLLVMAVIYLLFLNPVASIIGIPLGYIGIDLLFRYMNKRDNEEMMMDIYNTYANLKIQMTSGVYICDCLEYTFKIVKNERYKDAMRELILNFSDKTITSSEAVEIFRNRFNYREIDKLCAMIESFADYGISETYLNEIMFTAKELLEADAIKTQHEIESKVGVITFAFFVLVVILVGINMMGTFDGAEMFFA
jgi:Flp pilus assembly protein TadB